MKNLIQKIADECKTPLEFADRYVNEFAVIMFATSKAVQLKQKMNNEIALEIALVDLIGRLKTAGDSKNFLETKFSSKQIRDQIPQLQQKYPSQIFHMW